MQVSSRGGRRDLRAPGRCCGSSPPGRRAGPGAVAGDSRRGGLGPRRQRWAGLAGGEPRGGGGEPGFIPLSGGGGVCREAVLLRSSVAWCCDGLFGFLPPLFPTYGAYFARVVSRWAGGCFRHFIRVLVNDSGCCEMLC